PSWPKRLQYEAKPHILTAGTSLERTRKTCRDHAPSILHVATACQVFFSPHRFRLPRLQYAMATARSFCIPENSQPVISEWNDPQAGGTHPTVHEPYVVPPFKGGTAYHKP